MAIVRISRADFLARMRKQAVSANSNIKYPNGREQAAAKSHPFEDEKTDSGEDKAGTKRKNKHNNTRCSWNGLNFMSKVECKRFQHLHALQLIGEIKELQHEPRFELIPEVVLENKTFPASTYTADSSYIITATGEYVVEDVKGGDVTQLFQWKRKMMMSVYGIEIKLWRRSGDSHGRTRRKTKTNG